MRMRGFIGCLVALIGTAAWAETDGKITGTIDGHEIDLAVQCAWTDDATLGIKSHDFIMLSTSFEERPALQMNFYNNSYFLILLVGGKSYQMVDQNPDGSLKPAEKFHHKGEVHLQAGHDGPYSFDLMIECPRG